MSPEISDDLISYVLQYGGMCRDCADNNGVCPTTGLSCDHQEAKQAVRSVLRAVAYGVERGLITVPFLSRAPQTGAVQEGWQPIETVPRDASMVDLWTAGWGRLTNCRWDQGKWWRHRNGYEEYEIKPSHWMALPAAPTQPKESDGGQDAA